MSRLYFGTLYLVHPDFHGDPDHLEESVVESYTDGPSHIDVAIELWRLAGHEDRAARIKALIDGANERDYPALDTAEVKELLQLLDGLSEALEQSFVGADGRVPPERMSELRRRSRMLDLGEGRGDLARAAVWEGMSRVIALGNILKEALERGLHVALD